MGNGLVMFLDRFGNVGFGGFCAPTGTGIVAKSMCPFAQPGPLMGVDGIAIRTNACAAPSLGKQTFVVGFTPSSWPQRRKDVLGGFCTPAIFVENGGWKNARKWECEKNLLGAVGP